MLRVVVFGDSGQHRTEASIARAVRTLGHGCMLIDPRGWQRRLGPLAGRGVRGLVRAYSPDVVILTRYAAALDDQTLAAVTAGRYAALWFFDLVEYPHERILRLGRAAGTMYVTCPSQIDLYRARGVPAVRFLPQAADPAIDRPVERTRSSFRCDVSFIGSGQYTYRHALLRRVAGICHLQIRGPSWDGVHGDLPVAGGPLRGQQFAQAVRGAALSLGALALPAQGCERACASNRMWKVMGCGGCYLGPRVPGIEHFARDGEHCVWYDSADHAVELVQTYLAAPAERTAIAEAGRRHTLAAHTYADRMRLLLEEQAYPIP